METVEHCTSCDIELVKGPHFRSVSHGVLCDVCCAMLQAVFRRAHFRIAHQEWLREVRALAANKARLMGGGDAASS